MTTRELVVVGGPNGAGKTTLALKYASVRESSYLAADKIAAEILPADPSSVKVEAASRFVQLLDEALTTERCLIVESTLSGRTFRHWIRSAKDQGFSVTIAFVILDSADLAVDRVAERRQKGGHDVPESDIRRRFGRSMINFWEIYRPLCNHWLLTNNSGNSPVDIAIGTADTISVRDSNGFNAFLKQLSAFNHG